MPDRNADARSVTKGPGHQARLAEYSKSDKSNPPGQARVEEFNRV